MLSRDLLSRLYFLLKQRGTVNSEEAFGKSLSTETLKISKPYMNKLMNGTREITKEIEESVHKVYSKELKELQETSPQSEVLSEKDRRLLDIMDKWATAIVDANVTAKELALANNSLIGVMQSGKTNSVPSLEKKVDLLFAQLDSIRLGTVATKNFLFRQVAKLGDREVADVENEYMDNDLAAAAGLPSQANTPAQSKNVGRKGRVDQSS